MFERRSARHARVRQQSPAQAAALRRLTAVTGEGRGQATPVGVGGWVPRAPQSASTRSTVAAGEDAADEPAASERHGSDDDEEADVRSGLVGSSDETAPAAMHPRESPSIWLISRFGLAPRHVAVVAIVLLVAVGLAGVALMRSRPRDVPVPVSSTPPPAGLVAATPGAAPTADAGGLGVPPAAVPSPTPTAVLLVDVVGRVHRPGVVRLPPGARVQDALAAAGGAEKGVDLATLNLARPVVDGEQIAVGVRSRAPAPAGGAAGATPDTVIDLNTATLEQLETLPDVGPVTAQRILDFRASHGGFTSVDDLREISGIGEKTFADIAPHVRV